MNLTVIFGCKVHLWFYGCHIPTGMTSDICEDVFCNRVIHRRSIDSLEDHISVRYLLTDCLIETSTRTVYTSINRDHFKLETSTVLNFACPIRTSLVQHRVQYTVIKRRGVAFHRTTCSHHVHHVERGLRVTYEVHTLLILLSPSSLHALRSGLPTPAS